MYHFKLLVEETLNKQFHTRMYTSEVYILTLLGKYVETIGSLQMQYGLCSEI